jgi:carbonic anhydrase
MGVQQTHEGLPTIKLTAARDRLLDGVRQFRREVYPKLAATFKKVMQEGQKPHSLFITCADSRIDPEILTQSAPGEIFVSRNIGNLVPAYGEMLGGVSAIIEYAVVALNVSQIVVCGHSDCGAMIGLLHPEKVAGVPTVKSWLRNGEAALSIVQSRSKTQDQAAMLDDLIEENVLLQMKHLMTHPSVAGRLTQGSLLLTGWVYDIAHGDVRIFEDAPKKFVPLPAASAAS